MPPSPTRLLIYSAVIVVFLLFPIALRSQETIHATTCDLKQKPADFNHKLVEVTGYVSHGFEEFELFDPRCPDATDVWLDYGGRQLSGTTYCCGDPGDGTRGAPIKVEGLQIPLVANQKFKNFNKLIHAERSTIVQATLIGRFFAGKDPGKTKWGAGYGHLGCCTLFVIQQVLSVEPYGNPDLDYSNDDYMMSPPTRGCAISDASKDREGPNWQESQQKADIQGDEIRFDHPEKIARSELMRAENLDESAVANLYEAHREQGRITYQLKIANQDGTSTTYSIVLHKPYRLTFYAINPHRIIWVVIAAYKTTCIKLTP
jgi:hypothetical protein